MACITYKCVYNKQTQNGPTKADTNDTKWCCKWAQLQGVEKSSVECFN